MRTFLFKKIKLSKEDKKNPLCYSLASRTMVPYLLNSSPEGGRALDVGCGIGFLSNILTRKFAEVVGVDPDEGSLEKAKTIYRSPRLKFLRGRAENIPLPDDSVDFLVCSTVLEHVDDLERTFQEMKRVCKPDSRFFIAVPPAKGIFGYFFLKIGHDESSQNERDKRPPFTRKDVTKLLLNNDFQIEKTFYSKIFLAEMFMGLTKIMHKLKKGGSCGSQSDILMPPKIYQKLFPLILFLAKLEDFVLNDVLKGHVMIITGEIKK